MSPVSLSPAARSAAASATSAATGSVGAQAATAVLKQALDSQASSVTQLLNGLPSPALATSGPVGTQVNTYA